MYIFGVHVAMLQKLCAFEVVVGSTVNEITGRWFMDAFDYSEGALQC